MSNRAKRERWAREAIAITDKITEEGKGRYLCPLCLEWHQLDELSLEHAPPSSVGGRPVAVTCRVCNSTSGHTVDAELRRAERVLEFASRKMTKSMPATVRFGDDVEQNVDVTFGPERLSIIGAPERNHPDTAAAVTAALQQAASSGEAGQTITLSLQGADFRRAAVAWLRVGYLVAFATLGYLYILREELEPVRQQIRTPDSEILHRFCLMAHDATERQIAFVEDPHEFASFMVITDGRTVLLPSDTYPGTYERLASVEPWPPGLQTLSGQTAPWQPEPVYACDREAIARAGL